MSTVVATGTLGIPFNPKKKSVKITAEFPIHADIISVYVKADNPDVLWVDYIYKINMLTVFETFEFLVVNFEKETSFKIDNHKYFDSIKIDNEKFLVFYKSSNTEDWFYISHAKMRGFFINCWILCKIMI